MTITNDVQQKLTEAARKIANLPGIRIELVGAWLWVDGNTKPVRKQLKDAGFRYASKKQKWYFAGIQVHNKHSMNWDYITNKYGERQLTDRRSRRNQAEEEAMA